MYNKHYTCVDLKVPRALRADACALCLFETRAGNPADTIAQLQADSFELTAL